MPRNSTADAAHSRPASKRDDQTDTDNFPPTEQSLVQSSLIDAWVKTLQAAEAMHLCLHPTYVRHSESELIVIVQRALHDRHGPSQMVAEMLAQGRRSLARTA